MRNQIREILDSFTCIGYHLLYQGDEVVILWPWHWKFEEGRLHWLFSLSFMYLFASFAGINNCWNDYDKALQRVIFETHFICDGTGL